MLEDHAALLPPMKELYAAMTAPLPKREREVVELRIAGATYREIARSLGVSTSSVGVYLRRAKEKMQQALSAYEESRW